MSRRYSVYLPLIALFISSFSLLEAQTVSTTPVGYQTVTIQGSLDGTTPAFTALSAGFQNASLHTGTLTEGTSTFVFTDSNASLVADTYSSQDPAGSSAYYLIFTSGANEGMILDITGNTASTITCDTGYTSGGSFTATSGDAYSIRAYSTIADVFGAANTPGLKSGGNASSSDLIYVMSTDGNATYTTYYYQTDSLGGILGGTGWRVFGDSSTDMSSIALAPDDGIIISRTGTGDLELVTSGEVKDTNHQRDMPAGFSLIAYPFPVDVTLAESNIYTATNGYVSGGNGSSSDLVYVISSDGTFATYYRQTDSLGGILGGDGWRSFGDSSTSRDSEVIPSGSSIIIYHRGSGLSWSDETPYTL